MLEPIENPDLVDRVYVSLRRAIHEGTLPPGARLVERQLGDQLDVSRAPVRDALRMLERDGLVVSAGRRGKIVATLSAQDAWEVYTLRATLEAMAFRLAAQRATSDTIAELETTVGEMRRKVEEGDVATLAALDLRFHEAVCRASGHARLLAMWTAMSRQIQVLLHVDTRVGEVKYQDIPEQPLRHQRLVDAIRSGDGDAAEALARGHIEAVSERVIARLRDLEKSSEAGPGAAGAVAGDGLRPILTTQP